MQSTPELVAIFRRTKDFAKRILTNIQIWQTQIIGKPMKFRKTIFQN